MEEKNTHNGHEFVDLGLPSGTLWATCNVGATSPEQAGLYFAFGETTGFTVEQVKNGERSFDKKSYKAKNLSADYISLYLIPEQDTAHMNLGGDWRMPTEAEFQELIDNCDVTWVSNYMGKGVAGRLFTSRVNGNSVFFPAAGDGFNSSVSGVGKYADYWAASWISSSNAWRFSFTHEDQRMFSYTRCYGYSVRGVCE